MPSELLYCRSSNTSGIVREAIPSAVQIGSSESWITYYGNTASIADNLYKYALIWSHDAGVEQRLVITTSPKSAITKGRQSPIA